ncbi:hypothetical protein B5M09_011376, partial [Aphanomyces astaci]
LKALVQDKNVRIDELRRQLELARADFDAKQQAAHDDQERRNKRLYQDNHAYIGQLKDALDKIQHLEAQGGGQAVVAAREMHQGLMDQLKQVHMDVQVKEIATLQKVNHSLVCDVEAFEKGHQRQTSQWKADLLAKDKKMALLRDAIIKLKEEFLKAQEQQAEDSVREKRKQTSQQHDRIDDLTDKNAHLTATITMLQEKVDGLTCEIQDVNQKYKRAMALVAKSKAALNSRDQLPGQLLKAAELRDQLDRCKAKLGTSTTVAALEDVIANMKRVMENLRSENDRLRKIKSIKAPVKAAANNKELQQLAAIVDATKAELQQLRIEHSDLARKFRALGAKYKACKDTHATFVADMEHLHSVQLQDKDKQIHDLIILSRAKEADDDQEHVTHQDAVVRQLRQENARLTAELSAFDLDFFDEIEDLKFKYAQAIRQKQALETQLAAQLVTSTTPPQ